MLSKKYGFTRGDICLLIEKLLANPIFQVQDAETVASALEGFRLNGGFADHLIVAKAQRDGASALLSFDRELQKIYPEYVLQP